MNGTKCYALTLINLFKFITEYFVNIHVEKLYIFEVITFDFYLSI